MKISKLYVAAFILIGLFFTGFQCSSTEITSAKLYIQQKNYDKALEALQKEVEKNPASDEGYHLLGYVYGEKEMYAEMIDSYNKSLGISKKFESQINDSKKYFWANLFNKGVGLYQRGVGTTDPDSSKMYLEKAIYNFKYAVQLEPDSADTYKNLAFVYLSAQREKEAIEPLQKLIDLEKSEDGYRYLGEIYYTEGLNLKNEYDVSKNPEDSIKAQEYFNKTITLLEEGKNLYPANTDILVVLSNSYIAANKIETAIDAFKSGVEQDPENKYYRYNYGVLLLGKNDFEGAEQQFQKAIQIDPEYQNAVYNLAVTYVKWGTDINKKNEAEGKMGDEFKEKYRQALPHLEKVVQMQNDDAGMWELLGRVYSVLGMQEDANNAFKKADEIRSK